MPNSLSAAPISTTEPWFQWIKKSDGWLASHHTAFTPSIDLSLVERRTAQTARLGAKPLWEGYSELERYKKSTTNDRSSNEVSTPHRFGAIYAWLAKTRRSKVIVEFGSAFGVSGMYWLTGLKEGGTGKLESYEPNDVWASIAEDNFKAVSKKFRLHRGPFEDLAASTLKPRSVDIAFIDAIHTPEFVARQYEILKPLMVPGGLVIFDDISFSPELKGWWKTIAQSSEFRATGQLQRRIGIAETHG